MAETDVRQQILIKETIDGIPVMEAAARRKPKTATLRQRHDPYIWGVYIMMLIISLIELFSASSSEVSGSNVYTPLIRHAIFLAIGLGCVLGLQKVHYGWFSRFAWFCAILSLVLLIISSVFGIEINGAQRAISIAGFTIQPAEIVKLTVVVLLATILGKSQKPGGVSNSGITKAAIVVVAFSACLWKNGLTNTILLMGVSLSMFLIGGIQWKKIGIVLIIYAIGVGALWMLKYDKSGADEFDNVSRTEQVAGGGANGNSDSGSKDRSDTHKGRMQRFFAGVHPNDPITDENRQVFFANISQANGGMFGQGPGNSRESARLPLAFSDYIYSIIVEDTGFVGGVFLLILYLFLLARAGRIAYKCSRAIPAFLIMGCAVLIVFQALVHMAIVTGLFPVSGQPLPFISKGGTSVVVMSCAIGIMLSVSRFAVTSGKKKDISDEGKALPSDLQAANYAGYQNNENE